MSERTFILEFNDRADEVNEYLSLLKLIERTTRNGQNSTRQRIDNGVALARASALLVLYNTIEASARSAIVAIYDEIGQKRVSFDELKTSLRRKIISDCRNNLSSDSSENIDNIAFDLIKESFEERKIFSGNVDARKIKEIAKGFELNLDGSDYMSTAHGEKLLEVKTHRNDLAHGVKSFLEVGRNYTTNDIERIISLSLAYLRYVLEKVDEYLTAENFKEQSIQNLANT